MYDAPVKTRVLELAGLGLNSSEIARRAGISRTAVRSWRANRRTISVARRAGVELMDTIVGPKY